MTHPYRRHWQRHRNHKMGQMVDQVFFPIDGSLANAISELAGAIIRHADVLEDTNPRVTEVCGPYDPSVAGVIPEKKLRDRLVLTYEQMDAFFEKAQIVTGLLRRVHLTEVIQEWLDKELGQ